jgi:hypothetical protein
MSADDAPVDSAAEVQQEVEEPAEAAAEAEVEAEAEETKKPETTLKAMEACGMDVNATTSYFAQFFLDKSHYHVINEKLAEKWDRLHSLSAALKLMEKYGVTISPEEEQRLAQLDEDRQIEALVTRMPQQNKNDFQQFFLQLQVLVSSAMRVRQALEHGNPGEVEQCLKDADSTGIMPYILRMSVVQAGAEVSSMKKRLKAWAKDMDIRMSKKIRGQEDAMLAQKKLNEAQKELAIFTVGQNEKSKKVIMNFLNGSAAGLIASSFKGWKEAVKTEKHEREVAGEFKDKIEAINAQLLDFKTKNLEGVRKMMKAKAGEMASTLLRETFDIWHKEVFDWKKDKEMQEELAQLNAAMAAAKDEQKARSRSVLARMNADSDQGLMQMIWGAWMAFHLEYQKDKAMEDEVKAKEQAMKEYLKTKADSAKKVLQASVGNTESGLIQMAFQGWVEVYHEAQEEARMAEILNGAESKFSSLGTAGKMKGKSALEKATHYLEEAIILRCWNAWRLDTRVEATLRQFHGKIEAKRKQLVGVQEMFRSFANELESGLKRGAESTRGEIAPAVLKGRGFAKSDSLPDINQKLSSGRRQQSRTHEKDAMSRSQGQIRARAPDGSDRERKEIRAAYPASSPAAEGGPGAPRNAWG